MIHDIIERWHRHMRGDLAGGLDELLDDDVIFYSPLYATGGQGDYEALPECCRTNSSRREVGHVHRPLKALPLHEAGPLGRHRRSRIRDHRGGKVRQWR